MKSKRAFTLVELVIAIGITGFLLSAVFLVSTQILTVWSEQAEDPLFDRHVDGLRRALEECVVETDEAAAGAGATAATAATGAGAVVSTSGRVRAASSVFTAPPREANVEFATYLRISGSPPFLAGATWPLGFVHAWLVFEVESGLVLYWQTDDERRQAQDSARRLILSPWVENVSFSAYDPANDEWLEFDNPAPEQVPSGAAVFMKIDFSHLGQTRQITLSLTDSIPFNLNY
jgi:prepilin-type N-terminal cleavage/methylation domain-containing protein